MTHYNTENAQFSRFFDNLADYPHCTDSLKAGCRQAPKEVAAKRRYIEHNKPNYSLTYMGLDLDYEWSAWAWYDENLPAPTFAAVNPENAHCLMVYEVKTPVHLGGNASEAAIRYFYAVRQGYIKALDGDPSFTGFLSKNPLSDAWRVLSYDVRYDLDELAEPLRDVTLEEIAAFPDDELWHEHLRKYYIPLFDKKPRKSRQISDDPTDSLFVHHNTRWWAYTITADCKRRGELHDRIEIYIRDMDTDYSLNLRESKIRSETNSVTKFCWTHRVDFISKRRAFEQRQSDRAYGSHRARKRNTSAKIRNARQTLRKEGRLITKSALAETAGLSRRALDKRVLKTDQSEVHKVGAYKTADIKRAATEAKIKQAFGQALREGIKPTQKNIANLAGVGIATVKRYWQKINT